MPPAAEKQALVHKRVLTSTLSRLYWACGMIQAKMTNLLDNYRDEQVVVDTDSRLSYLGRLTGGDEHYLRLTDVAIYDLEVVRVSLEEYLIECAKEGAPVSRKEILIKQSRVMAVSRLSDIIQP